MLRVVTGLIGLAASASVAMAADLGTEVAVPVPPLVPATHDWSGWYAGGYAGYVWGTFTGDLSQAGLSGFDGGVQVFYNAPLHNNWILSPFVAATLPVQKSYIGSIEAKIDWAVEGGLRLGYAMDRWLPYVLAGGVIGQATATDADLVSTNTHVGYMLGAGVDYAVDDRWTLGLRYAYYNVGEKVYMYGTTVGWYGHSVVGTISFKLH